MPTAATCISPSRPKARAGGCSCTPQRQAARNGIGQRKQGRRSSCHCENTRDRSPSFARRWHRSSTARKTAEQAAAIAGAPTFGKMADDHVAAMKPSWRNAKHAAQWDYTLKELAAPLTIQTGQPDRNSGCARSPATAMAIGAGNGQPPARPDRERSGCRQGQRLPPGENPARWRGHLSLLLPKRETAHPRPSCCAVI